MSRGSSLAEVAVALVLLSVSGLAAVALLHEAARTVRSAEIRERLLWAVADVADSLAATSGDDVGERTLPGVGRVRWRVGEGGGDVTGTVPGGTGPWVTVPIVREPAAGPPG